MRRQSNPPAQEAVWSAMVHRAEALHDTVVLGQRRATLASAQRIRTLARDLTALAEVATLLRRPRS